MNPNFYELPSKRVLTPQSTSRPFLLVQAVIKSDVQTSRLHTASHVLICRNSSGTIIRCSRSHVNHSAVPKLFRTLCFIYDCIFPCHRKVRTSRGWLAGTELPKHFTKTGRLSSAAQAGKAVGCGFTFGRRALSFIYSQFRVESCNFFFNMQNICPVIAENSGQIDM